MTLYRSLFGLALLATALATPCPLPAQSGSVYDPEVPIADAFATWRIVDAHAHFGKAGSFDLPVRTLTDSMDSYGVVRALVSDVEGQEYTGDAKLIPATKAFTQMQVAKKTVQVVQASKGKLWGLVWIRPHTETVTKEFRDYLKANRKWLVGLKFHPWHSQIPIDDKRLEPYLALAEELKLTVLVHTSVDENSLVSHVVAAAKAHPKVNFLAGHMNMGGDKGEVIAAVRDLPNLYGDTAAFFGEDDLLTAVRVAGASKLLFGTDAPVGGDDTYAASFRTWDILRQQLTPDELDLLLHDNALRLFGLPPL